MLARTMDRRSFLALGASSAALAATGCESLPPPDPPRVPLPPSWSAETPVLYPDLEEATIAGLAGRMDRGEISSAEIVGRYLARIDALDRKGPALRSVLELNPDAAAVAAQRDEERRAGRARGPLHGVPILLKDNIDTGDRMATTAGSLALAGAPAPRDAHLVTKLREAGAVILGKTNLSEWANIRSSRSTSGWSGRGGLTRHPYALDRNPSGSSSGSAVAVAANLCAAAIGSETDGSIVSPASICGIVGLKPTVGLVSRSGIIPISHTQDTAGPMTRTVADAALLLQAIAGTDPRDPATAGAPHADYLAALRPEAARGRRIGVVRRWNGISSPVMAVFDAAIEDLRRLGAVIVDPVDLGPTNKIDEPEMAVLLYELKADMARYLAERQHPGGARTLDDLVRFNKDHAREEMLWFGQELFEQAIAKGSLDAPEYKDALAACRRFARDEGIDAAIKKHRLDALVAPTGGVAWLSDPVNGDQFTGSSSTPAAVAGYPSITVPAGVLGGLPVGVSFFAGAYSEPALIGIAYAYEQATRKRQKPRYLPSVEMG
jgi:amidase